MRIIIWLITLFARGYADSYPAIHPIRGVVRISFRLINSYATQLLVGAVLEA